MRKKNFIICLCLAQVLIVLSGCCWIPKYPMCKVELNQDLQLNSNEFELVMHSGILFKRYKKDRMMLFHQMVELQPPMTMTYGQLTYYQNGIKTRHSTTPLILVEDKLSVFQDNRRLKTYHERKWRGSHWDGILFKADFEDSDSLIIIRHDYPVDGDSLVMKIIFYQGWDKEVCGNQ